MARTVLSCRPSLRPAAVVLLVWTLASCSGAPAPSTEAPRAACVLENEATLPPEQLDEARVLAERLERGTLFAELTRRYGPATGCRAESTGPSLRVTASFRAGVRLEVGGQKAIELTEIRIVLPDGGDSEALALLKLAERDTFGTDGCGIDWDQPEAENGEGGEARRELVFRGDACNCHGRITRGSEAFVVLLLRAAC